MVYSRGGEGVGRRGGFGGVKPLHRIVGGVVVWSGGWMGIVLISMNFVTEGGSGVGIYESTASMS